MFKYKLTRKMLVFRWGLLLALLALVDADSHRRFDDELSLSMIEKGKTHLTDLEQKSHLPRYGDCWLQALDHLRDGCRALTDSTQIDLALHFTNCFMEMSGQDRLDCVSERTEALKRLCMSEMSDRAFTVYTEFFTQTQNMCFFLQSQSWQAEADRTVERLSVKSREVSERLVAAGEVQRVVLQHQQEGLRLQEQMLKLGGGLAQTLNGSQGMLDRLTAELRNSTHQHQTVLAELFREFYLLHSWLVGRYAFVDRIVFYVAFLLATMVATSTKRTGNSRTFLILNLVLGLLIELTLSTLTPSLDPIQRDQLIWIFRKLFTASALVIYLVCSYRYQDINAKLLHEIKEQNRQIMDSILRMKLESHNTHARTGNSNAGSSTIFFQSHLRNRKPDVHDNDERESQSTYSYSVVQDQRNMTAPEVVIVPPAADYERENSLNERRSSERRSTRAPSQTSESSVSRTGSRYNLRRKIMPGGVQ